MAKTPVSMAIDGYKEREVLMVTTPDLLAWMCERSLPKNGEIKFLETKTNKEMKSIKFTNGYCIDFEEKWEDKLGHFEEIEITCKEIEFGNVKYTNDWA